MPDEKIKKIIKLLQADKSEALSDAIERFEKKTILKSVNLDEKIKEEKEEVKIMTGTLLDELIGGGLSPVSAMLLWGEYASGKTQTCFTMCVECPDDVIYVDAERSFRAQRIKQICDERDKDWNLVKQKIHLFQPTNWVEQMLALYSFPSPPDTHTGKVGLIIIDSLTKLFRGIEFAGRESLTTKQPLIREFIFKLDCIIKSYNCALIFTSQIYESPSANPVLAAWTSHKAVGGASLLHQPDYQIFLRHGQGNIRIARVKDTSWTGALRERPFVITAAGIEDIPKDAKAAEGLLRKAKKFAKAQEQEKLKKAEAKDKKGKKKKEPQKVVEVPPS